MKLTDSRQLSPLISLLLKIICGILVLSFFVDFVILLYPFNLLDRQWQLSFATQIVDRGVVPLVGFAFFIAALWIDSTAEIALSKPKFWQTLALVTFLISSLLGLFFLLLIPFHLNNVSFARDEAFKRINEEAVRAESQIDAQIQQQQSQISNLLRNDQRLNELDQALKSGQVQGEQLTRLQRLQQELQQFKQDPQLLDKQAKESRNRELIKIRDRKQQLENQARTETLKSSIRTSMSSLLLTIGFIAVGWAGLKSLGSSSLTKSVR